MDTQDYAFTRARAHRYIHIHAKGRRFWASTLPFSSWNICCYLKYFTTLVNLWWNSCKIPFTGCVHVGHSWVLQHNVIPFVDRSLCRWSRLAKIFYFDCSTLYIKTLCSENKYCLLFKLFYHVHGSSWSISASPKGKKTNCCFSRRKKGSIILMGRPSQAWQEQICFLFSISFLLLIFFLMCVNIKKYDRGWWKANLMTNMITNNWEQGTK